MARTKTPGIRQRGSSFEAWVYSRRDGKKLYQTFPTYAAAKQWRTDANSAVSRGTMRASLPVTVREAWEAWAEGVDAGLIRTRAGAEYKPSVVRCYRSAMTLRVLPDFGADRLADVQRVDIQDFASKLLADGLDPSTIRNTLMPLRAVIRRAIQRNELQVNPLTGLELPTAQGKRDRIATPEEAERLIAALPNKTHRALWATACYAGLRRGELMGLEWQHVHADRIEVVRSWDVQAGPIETKSKSSVRSVPVPAILNGYLNRHKMLTGRREGLVFGATADRPFSTSNIRRCAVYAWSKVKPKPLAPIGLHECRHTYASMMIAAGVNAKALSTYMGHSSITITLDRYGKLFPGNEDEAAQLFDTYLERKLAANGAASGASAPRGL